MITGCGSDHSTEVPAALPPGVPVLADTQGRLRVSKTQRGEILAVLARSGESLPQFARLTGLKYSTLARWVQQQRPKPYRRSPRLRLVEAVVDAASGTGPVLVLQLPGGVRMEVADEKQILLVAGLLRALALPC